VLRGGSWNNNDNNCQPANRNWNNQLQNMKTQHLLYLLPFLFTACISLHISGLHSGYKNLSPAQKQKIKIVSDSTEICNLNNDQIIYSVTATQLLNCLQRNDSSVVYIWGPNCSSKNCILLGAAQSYCDKKNYKLYVVAEYYDMEQIDAQNNTKLPIFSINQKHYKTDYCNKYRKLFTRELVRNRKIEEDGSRFFVFRQDNLIRHKENLFEQ